jgi:hypothetical protein
MEIFGTLHRDVAPPSKAVALITLLLDWMLPDGNGGD